jgi:hypothetical protein
MGASVVEGPAATPLTSTNPRVARRILELRIVSKERLPASRRNPRKNRYRPTAIATEETIARYRIGIKRIRQRVTVFSRIAALI